MGRKGSGRAGLEISALMVAIAQAACPLQLSSAEGDASTARTASKAGAPILAKAPAAALFTLISGSCTSAAASPGTAASSPKFVIALQQARRTTGSGCVSNPSSKKGVAGSPISLNALINRSRASRLGSLSPSIMRCSSCGSGLSNASSSICSFT